MKTSEKIKAARKGKGLTQKDLAFKVGSAQATINKIERDEIKSPSFDLAVKIANALEKDVFELFTDESLRNKHLSLSEKEIDRLKILIFHSLDKYESDQVFLKQFDYNQEDASDWEKFKEYERYLSEFKKGILGKLMEVGFCTYEDIKAYRSFVLKQAKEKMVGRENNTVITYIDTDIFDPLNETEEKEIEQEKIKIESDQNYIPDRFKTPDGRPFIRKDIITSDGKIVATFNSPDQNNA